MRSGTPESRTLSVCLKANDPITRRTLLAMTKTVVCGFDNEGSGPVAAYGLVEGLGEESESIRVMHVPPNGGVLKILGKGGVTAVQAAMNKAIPFYQ